MRVTIRKLSIIMSVLLVILLVSHTSVLGERIIDEVTDNSNSLFYKLLQGHDEQQPQQQQQQPSMMVCGTRDEDVVGHNRKGRQKRYAVARFEDGKANKWDSDRLTWAVVDLSRQMSANKQRRIVRESLQVWSDVSPLNFVMVDPNNNPDISIRFARGRHGPTFDPAFDGRASPNRANIFGHAWGPGEDRNGIAGDVHIDEEDDWSEEHKLKGVLIHELGHSMGLSHSDDPEAIMFAVYRDATELADDDIRGIQFLYATQRRVTSRPRTLRPETRRPYATRRPYITVTEPGFVPTLRPDSPCLASEINAIVEDPFSVVDGLYYVFIGDTVHHIMSDGSPVGKFSMTQDFFGIPKDPDVVFTLTERKAIIFMKGSQLWELRENGLTEDSPRSLSHLNFPETPSYAISLFDVEGTRRLYLFGKRYWWSYYIDSSLPTNHYEIYKFSRDLPLDVTFATKWKDNNLYVVSRDSYIILDPARRYMVHERPYQGKPEWLMPLCSGVSSLTSHQSLLAIVLVSLVGLLIRR